MIGFNGGLIGKSRATSTDESVPGVWTLPEQALAAENGLWPINDPHFSNVSLLLHGDGANGSTTFTDSSPNNFTLTRFGNTVISTAQSKFGGASIYLDGTGDYLTVPDNNVFSLESNNFTIELWAYFLASTSGTGYNLIFHADNSFGANAGWALLRHSSNKLRFISSPTPTFTEVNITDSTNDFIPSVGQWYHIAAVRNSGVVRLYVDGTSVGSSSNNTTINNSTRVIGIGASSQGESVFNGYLDEIRITNGIARYTSSFTPPVRAFPDR